MSKRGINDRKLLLILGGVVLALIVAIAVLAPASAKDDPNPTTINNGPDGAKAAFLLLQQMGRKPVRWTDPLDNLDSVDATKSTLVLADPLYDPTQMKSLAEPLKHFLERGGRILATGSLAAYLLPDGKVKGPGIAHDDDCTSTPEGPGTLAAAGPVTISDDGGWDAQDPQFIVEQRCGKDAVVVRYAVGNGEVIWWSSATPLTNAGLKHDADLRLMLTSFGDNRTVLFDEALHTEGEGLWGKARGLPIGWMWLQIALVALLLILSFSRRRGPIRAPVALPRSSPLEFAESMGDLYSKGGATSAATDAALRRLRKVLVREAGIAQAAVDHGPDEIAAALAARLGGDWSRLAAHLRDANQAVITEVAPRSALRLVQALNEDAEQIRAALRPKTSVAIV